MLQRFIVIVISAIIATGDCTAQNINCQLNLALQKLSEDAQFKHSIFSLYVIDSKTGNVVFDRNSQVGLTPASCLKVITSVSAFELLGNNFKFKTYIDYDLPVKEGKLEGNLYVCGRGDPTLGSNRWKTSSEALVLKQILDILRNNKIGSIGGDLVCDDSHFTTEPLPRGWIWEDIGNYYGAGAWGLNWMENQFDITFKTGRILNDTTRVISTKPAAVMTDYTFANFVKTGARGSGDNAYLFSSPFQKKIIASGTVPISEDGFTISGSMPDPPGIFIKQVKAYLQENGIAVSGDIWTTSERLLTNRAARVPFLHLDSILSCPLDSINYWFLKRSVNLFGEAFVKMISYQRSGSGSTDTGIAIIKDFWSKRGIEKSALKMIDGSGLSPANRVSAHSLVTVMEYAKRRPWFDSFYYALPEINGIKMKDGYIEGVRSYTGYLKSRGGKEYTFSFMVNNFDGNAGSVREKMWKVLSIIAAGTEHQTGN